ncbi:MAG: MltR family transcriptional regulator [Candidatus Acidiferrum sp.]
MPSPESGSTTRDASFEEFKKVSKELDTESDRGCILIGASLLSNCLESLLRAALSTTPHAVKHAISPLFDSMGPLATFSAKIKLVYALGLIDQDRFTDLEKIRRIRNIAAHDYSPLSFESQEIIDIACTLQSANNAAQALLDRKVHEEPLPDSAKSQADGDKPQAKMSKERIRFTMTVSWIAGYLTGYLESFLILGSSKLRNLLLFKTERPT